MPNPTHFDILVVGAGPAGIAAAVTAAETGAKVGLVDDNAAPGGQIWRGESESNSESTAGRARLQAAGITQLCGRRIVHQPRTGILLAEGEDDLCELSYGRLVIATGARERFIPFPGWTLPNVMGAGGLQALVKSGLPVRGKKIVVAGTGPLLLAVAAYLHAHRAEIAAVCEQASWGRLAIFGLAIATSPAKISQALNYKRKLSGVSFLANSWPVAANGSDRVESVTLSRAGKLQTISCDYLACGFHLVPNIELAQLLGCELKNGCVQVDELQQTSVPGIFCAGEPTGIGGVEKALIEGQIAGLAAAGHAPDARKLFSARASAQRFARALERAFRLNPELRKLSAPTTIVCRCEDVRYSQLVAHSSWRSAKLHARCGMGPCQGRICGPATEFLFHWRPDSVRPPLLPAFVESLATLPSGDLP